MFKQAHIPTRSTALADVLIAIGIGAVIYGAALYAGEWEASYNPSYKIDLSFSALPLYALFSALRSIVAYLISFGFTLAVGYWAAKSQSAERIILPLLDIFQSIPVLGFLPGLVLGLVAIFPRSNVGLELAAILMIFTGQVWNMTFSFYSSLKSVPGDLQEASAVMGLSPLAKLFRLELPFAAVNLVWNSIMSMAGGWFFLTVCEAFTLGGREYRLPGLGAYMAAAIEKGDTHAMVFGVAMMAAVIVLLDSLIWRPALAWVHRFRLEETEAASGDDKLLSFVLLNSRFVQLIRDSMVRRKRLRLLHSPRLKLRLRLKFISPGIQWRSLSRYTSWPLAAAVLALLAWACLRLVIELASLPLQSWVTILEDTSFTALRVFGCVLIGSLWAVPMGIWLSRNANRLRTAQPIAQLLASFPAPMLYPLVLGAMLAAGLDFSFGSMLLMLLGVQWYILFNTMAGGLRIPQEISSSMDLIGSSQADRWRYLYLPSVFPSLVTGWVTAAGGAWNASVVAELISYKGQTLQTRGLGALISHSAANGDFPMLAACLVVMVLTVVMLNRLLWNRIYRLAQTRFRLDL